MLVCLMRISFLLQILPTLIDSSILWYGTCKKDYPHAIKNAFVFSGVISVLLAVFFLFQANYVFIILIRERFFVSYFLCVYF